MKTSIMLNNKARNHVKRMEKEYGTIIQAQVNSSSIHDENNTTPVLNKQKYETKIEVSSNDTVSEIFKYATKNNMVTALNFASYKIPGGGFMAGAMAQEEALCHESTLYNVISDDKFKPYYDFNNQNKNKALYLNRAIYSPGIIFEYHDNFGNDHLMISDIITCAAPNARTFLRYNPDNVIEVQKTIISRARFILSVASMHNTDTLVLGALGCGVFGCDPIDVAYAFKALLDNEFNGVFRNVSFAILGGGNNYKVFKEIFNK